MERSRCLPHRQTRTLLSLLPAPDPFRAGAVEDEGAGVLAVVDTREVEGRSREMAHT